MDPIALVIIIIVLILLLILSAFFSGTETAYTSVSFSRIETDFKKGFKSAKLIKKHYKSFGVTLATILISNNIVNIGASSLTTYLFANLLGSSPTTTLLSIFVVTPILVVFGEIIPKLMAKKFAYGYLKKIAFIMEILNKVFFIFTYPLSKITLQSKITNSEKDLQNLIQLAKTEGVLDHNEATLAKKALDIDRILVKKAMIKKEDIVSISVTSTILTAKKVFISSGHSRILIKERGKFVGVLFLKDIIIQRNNVLIKPLIKPLINLSQSIRLSKALEAMRRNRVQMALVVQRKDSNYVVGIITIEDIIEELFGEIYDEHDKSEKVMEIAHSKYVVDGQVKMKEVAKNLNFKFEKISDLSLKQWVQSRINRKIKKGLRYEYKEAIVFKVIKNSKNSHTIFEIIKKI